MKKTGGSFKPKRVRFSQVSNIALHDNKLSLKAKGLYSLIQSYITIENFVLYKSTLMKQCKESEMVFHSAWKELKDTGYLKQEKKRNPDIGCFYYEYELLDTPVQGAVFQGVDNPLGGKQGSYNKTDFNNTDLNNTDKNYYILLDERYNWYFNAYLQFTGQNHRVIHNPIEWNQMLDDVNQAEFIELAYEHMRENRNHKDRMTVEYFNRVVDRYR